MKHFLNLIDQPADVLPQLLALAQKLKASRKDGQRQDCLAGKVVGLVFEKPSLRTRMSFEAGIAHLGGTSLFYPGNEIGLGWRETLADFARTMSRFLDAAVLRVYRQETLNALAEYGNIPIINGLSDRSHPCQAVADLLTIQECFGEIVGRTVVFVGDGNNVAMSLAVACQRVGAHFILACPKGYEFDETFLRKYEEKLGGQLPAICSDPIEAVRNADVIYADVWTSMGQESERDERLRHFAKFQIHEKLLAKAPSHAKVFHCLPAHRGEEITDAVIDGPQSVVFDQAENRLHAQKAVLQWLFQD